MTGSSAREDWDPWLVLIECNQCGARGPNAAAKDGGVVRCPFCGNETARYVILEKQ